MEDNKWKLLDELGRKITTAIRYTNEIQVKDIVSFSCKKDTLNNLLQAKDLINQLKSHLIKEVRAS